MENVGEIVEEATLADEVAEAEIVEEGVTELTSGEVVNEIAIKDFSELVYGAVSSREAGDTSLLAPNSRHEVTVNTVTVSSTVVSPIISADGETITAGDRIVSGIAVSGVARVVTAFEVK